MPSPSTIAPRGPSSVNGAWLLPSRREIWRRPMPHLPGWHQRLIMRGILSAFRRDVIGVHDISRLDRVEDPFIVVLNHSTRLEALILPILFTFYRQGSLISFVADWNFALVPGIATILRAGETILLVRKPAKPAFLNVFKPYFLRRGPAFERAARALNSGRSVGIFPEGTTNRHPRLLLRGYDGAARLSLETGRPVVPVGVRFPGLPPEEPIRDRSRMEVYVGEAMRPGPRVDGTTREEVRDWHEQIMRQVGRLSGKHWEPGATRRKHHGLE